LSKGSIEAAKSLTFEDILGGIIYFGISVVKRLFLGTSRRSATQRRSLEMIVEPIASAIAEILKAMVIKSFDSVRRSGGSNQAQRRSNENLQSDIFSLFKTITKRMLLLNDDMTKKGPKPARRQRQQKKQRILWIRTNQIIRRKVVTIR
jgi:hypothetical protein